MTTESVHADAITLALTGQLPFVILLAAGLAWPVSLGLLWLYRRAVLRSMHRVADGTSETPDPYVPLSHCCAPSFRK